MYSDISQILREKEHAFELRKTKKRSLETYISSILYSKPNILRNGRAKHLQVNTFFGVAVLRLVCIKNIVHLLSEKIKKISKRDCILSLYCVKENALYFPLSLSSGP